MSGESVTTCTCVCYQTPQIASRAILAGAQILVTNACIAQAMRTLFVQKSNVTFPATLAKAHLLVNKMYVLLKQHETMHVLLNMCPHRDPFHFCHATRLLLYQVLCTGCSDPREGDDSSGQGPRHGTATHSNRRPQDAQEPHSLLAQQMLS